VEFEAAQDASSLGGREGLIQRPRFMDRLALSRLGRDRLARLAD
jgi:hypothetical protein